MSSLGCDCTGRLSTKSEGGNGLRLCGGLVGRNSPYDDFRMQRMITSHDVMSKMRGTDVQNVCKVEKRYAQRVSKSSESGDTPVPGGLCSVATGIGNDWLDSIAGHGSVQRLSNLSE